MPHAHRLGFFYNLPLNPHQLESFRFSYHFQGKKNRQIMLACSVDYAIGGVPQMLSLSKLGKNSVKLSIHSLRFNHRIFFLVVIPFPRVTKESRT